MKWIAPSILSADFAKLGDEVRAVENAGADWIHADVMDGHFVPNITMGPVIIEAVKRNSSLPVDVHLMIENPERYIPDFANAGADFISIQVEACTHLNRTVHLIRESGARAGVVLNPATPITAVEWVLEDVDFVLIMSVNPGFGGQTFIPNSLNRIRELRRLILGKGLSTRIEVDGGIKESNIGAVSEAGADIFVAGSAIFGARDYAATIRRLKEKANTP
ncbi:MAG: ribulose-phosphate 3-epimerase [Deltaproteobacteria bacterium RBG_13_49_15]|nr:MAG: ribulose-phosphate 3-epimerase [Deltaproteobacteria bacterium RBG_13_49_15]